MIDAAVADSPPGCDPATVLPAASRPIAKVAAGAVGLTATADGMAGPVDATAGGVAGSADNPYI